MMFLREEGPVVAFLAFIVDAAVEQFVLPISPLLLPAMSP